MEVAKFLEKNENCTRSCVLQTARGYLYYETAWVYVLQKDTCKIKKKSNFNICIF